MISGPGYLPPSLKNLGHFQKIYECVYFKCQTEQIIIVQEVNVQEFGENVSNHNELLNEQS